MKVDITEFRLFLILWVAYAMLVLVHWCAWSWCLAHIVRERCVWWSWGNLREIVGGYQRGLVSVLIFELA